MSLALHGKSALMTILKVNFVLGWLVKAILLPHSSQAPENNFFLFHLQKFLCNPKLIPNMFFVFSSLCLSAVEVCSAPVAANAIGVASRCCSWVTMSAEPKTHGLMTKVNEPVTESFGLDP